MSHYAFEHGKTSNEKRLHEGTYYEIRTRYKLPSEMTNNVIRQVSVTYKSLWTKIRKNTEHRRNSITKKRFKGLDKPPKYVSPTVMYNFGYDYGFKPEQQVSIMTLERRFKLDVNHVIAKTIIEQHPQAFIGLENLTGIRERTKRRKYRRKGNKILPLTPKQRRVNRQVSKWAFAELHDMIMYQATLAGSMAIKVDADYTSKACLYVATETRRTVHLSIFVDIG